MDKREKIIVGVSVVMITAGVLLLLGLSAAAQKVMMPNLIDFDWDDAEDALVDIGVKHTEIEFQRVDGIMVSIDDVAEYGNHYRVIAQEPEAGEVVNLAKRDKVHLLVRVCGE